jgi:sec-independent protein translocase protein TatA
MLAFLEGPDLIIVAVIVLVIFGGSKIPQLARSLGEAQREFKKGLSNDDEPKPSAAATPAEAPSDPAAPDGSPTPPSDAAPAAPVAPADATPPQQHPA